MARILLLVLGFLGGAGLGFGAAYGAFELLNPPPPESRAGDPPDTAKKGRISERANRRMDWLIGGSVVGGLIGLAAAYFLAKPESDTPRPPADFKIGDPPPDLR